MNHRAGLLTQQIIAQQQGTALLSALQQFQRVSWAALIIGMAKLLTMAWLAIRQAFQPIGTLTDAATAIAAGDLTRTVPVESDDEIGILARAFNRMTEQLRSLIGNLEQRVDDRTAELRMANEKLQREITERKRAEEQIQASLKEKEVLLQEIHHRVKNNLQVISSLLNLQSGYVDDPQSVAILQDSQNRIRSMALVHEKLYQSQDLARIDFAEYIRNLATYLLRAYNAHAQDVTLDIQIDDIFLGIDTAVPCGLMLNELISNALKHAFPNGRKGEIRIALRAGDGARADGEGARADGEGARADGDGTLTLTVSDSGVGLPEGFDFQDTPSLGLRLVNSLVHQLDGRIEVHNHSGIQVRITFDG